MKTFSMSDAVAEPFRIAFKRPLMTTVWGLLLILPVVIGLAGMAPLMGEMFSDIDREAREGHAVILSEDVAPAGVAPEGAAPTGVLPADAAPTVLLEPVEDEDAPPPFDMATMMQFQMLNALSNLVQLAGVLLVTTAIARAVFAGRRGDGAAFLRISKDEFYVAVIGVGVFVVAMIVGILMVVLGFGVAFGLGQVANPWRWLIGIGLFFAGFAAFMLFWGRMALLAPTAVLRGDFALEEGWRLGRGQTWKLLGMLFVLVVIAMAIGLAIFLIVLAMIALFGGGLASPVAMLEDEAALEAWWKGVMANPWPMIAAGVAVLIPMAWFQGLQHLLFTAPYARVVKDLAAEPAPISTDAPATSE